MTHVAGFHIPIDLLVTITKLYLFMALIDILIQPSFYSKA